MESSSLSPAPSSSIHLALAALFGASVMAVSAFFLHKRTVDQVLDRLVKIRHQRRSVANRHSLIPKDDNGECENFGSGRGTDIDKEDSMRRDDYAGSLDEEVLDSYKVSPSLPNVNTDQSIQMNNQEASFSMDNLDVIASGLPPLQMTRKDGNVQHVSSGSQIRVGSVGRLMTPKSSGGFAIGSTGDSDDEGTEVMTGEDVSFMLDDTDLTEYNIGENVNIDDTSVSIEVDNTNYFLDQTVGQVANEKSHMVQHSKVNPASTLIEGNDPTCATTMSPLMVSIPESRNKEEDDVWKMIRECLDLRETYVYREQVAPWLKEDIDKSHSSETTDPLVFVPVEKTSHYFRMEDGVFRIYASENDTVDLYPVASSTTFFTDMHYLLKVMSIGNIRTACHHRLRFLEEKFRLHLLVNADREFLAQKSAPHRDFYNIRKVDTHVHHSACMNQKHLLRFIKSKLRKEPDEVVIFRDGIYFTLKEVFESLQLTGYDLNVDLLDVHADKSTFHRFDKFNLKYNPCGQSRLREIFMKQDNLIQGRFLAEVTKQVLLDLEASKYQLAEYRISIYGRKESEWDQLASWFVNNELYSANAVWLIQLPRLYNVYKGMGTVTSFQNILDNVFLPLFEVTVDPNTHPQLHVFLMQVVGFDLVDDESKPERRPTKHMPKPAEWTNEFNPAYSYYAYYIYANLYTLNKLRDAKGLNTIRLRPHCGEAGDVDHLAAAFLLSHNISHGINLRKTPVLQYLYYLAQIGLAMSPLSNNSLFLDYHRNPFPMFFQRGLNVSLSTDDPLQIHLTKEPLVEEYSVAAKVWKLTSCDLCEIARNSVYQSGFTHADKAHWLGNQCHKRGPEGNDIHKTNVPDMRIRFRHETWRDEMQYICSGEAQLQEEIEF
ncbi:probable AMP deaminase [Impatiens glandulifera]|uniref:probable AMP deaminase n=1 Tax=Impatiens glandulifera TaxID=253017 RepID=UPI001FB0E24A|nr:probable AMP deaminase [Impatiens glandulifera]